MLSMYVVACVAMLPSLVVAERFDFGCCGWNFDNDVDPLAHTQQGSSIVDEFFAGGQGKVYLWNPNENEKALKSMKLSATSGSFTLSYLGDSAAVTTYLGSMKYQYMPKMEIELTTSASDDKLGIFSFFTDGKADLYPLLITKTDLILRGCTDVLLGRVESLYVLTNQDYSEIDTNCAIQAIKDTYCWDVEVHTQ